MSYLRYLTVASLRKHNPDWKIKIHFPTIPYHGNVTWNSYEHFQSQMFIEGNYLERLSEFDVEFYQHDLESYGFRSDVPETYKADFIRWRILNEEGGCWSDFDIFYIRSLSEMRENNELNSRTRTILAPYKTPGDYGIAFLFSAPKNPLFQTLENLSKIKLDLKKYESCGSKLFSNLNLEEFDNKIVNLPEHVVTNWNWYAMNELFRANHEVPNETIGLHWFAGHHISQLYNARLKEDNIVYCNNTICNAIIKSMDVQPPKKKISIIISSYRKPNLLKLFLFSLTQQNVDYKDYEIIVINDGQKNDSTEAVCSLFDSKLPIRYIFTGQRNKCNLFKKFLPRTPGHAIDIGVKQCTGDIIVLTCPEAFQLSFDSLKHLIDAVVEDENAIATVKNVFDDLNGSMLNNIVDFKQIDDVAIGDLKRDHSDCLIQKEVDSIANPFFMAMNKSHYLDIGGFTDDAMEKLVDKGCHYKYIEDCVARFYDGPKIINNNDLRFLRKVTYESQNFWHLHKIPKVFHLYWGGETMSFLRHLTCVSFRQFNPDWKIKIHRPKNPYRGNRTWNSQEYSLDASFSSEGTYLDELKNYDIEFVEHDFESYGFRSDVPETFKADYLRYRLLSTEGGVWSDFDIVYFKSISSAAFNNPSNEEADTGLYVENGLPHISFLFSSANNPMYEKLEVLAKAKLDTYRYESIGSDLFKLPEMRLDQFKIIPVNIEKNSIYYFQWKRLKDIFVNEVSLPNDSIGIHWFAGSRMSQYFDSKITAQNVSSFKNTICNIITNDLDVAPSTDLWHLKKIPKVLHLYWGEHNISYLRYLTVVSFRKQNPDWKIKIHRPKSSYPKKDLADQWSQILFCQRGPDYIKKLEESYVEFVFHDFGQYDFRRYVPETYKSDYLRYLILSTEGGVWSDFDVFYIKPMNSMSLNQKNNCDVDTGIRICENGLASTSFFLSSPGNPICSKLLVLAKQKIDLFNHQSIGSDLFSLPEMNLSNFAAKFGYISKDTIYGLDSPKTKDVLANNISLEHETIGICWHASNPIAQQFNKKTTPENIVYGNNTLSNAIVNSLGVKKAKNFVSVIIPSILRIEQLRWSLYSLVKQKTDFDFEVIVLNDGFEPDETELVCGLFSRRLNIRYFFTGQRNNGTLIKKIKRRNPNYVVDIGLEKCGGETVVLSGAEIFMPYTDTLDKLVKASNDNPESIVVPNIVDDLDGSILSELNNNFGSIDDFKKDKKVLVCREAKDLEKLYLMVHRKDLTKNENVHLVQIDAEVIHLYHGQSIAKRNYRVIEAPQASG